MDEEACPAFGIKLRIIFQRSLIFVEQIFISRVILGVAYPDDRVAFGGIHIFFSPDCDIAAVNVFRLQLQLGIRRLAGIDSRKRHKSVGGFYRKHDLCAFCRHTAVSEYNAVAVACGNGENIAVGAYGQRLRQIKRAASGGDGASVRRVAVSRVRISVYAEFG